jgi:hypothetical protein
VSSGERRISLVGLMVVGLCYEVGGEAKDRCAGAASPSSVCDGQARGTMAREPATVAEAVQKAKALTGGMGMGWTMSRMSARCAFIRLRARDVVGVVRLMSEMSHFGIYKCCLAGIVI